MAANVKFMTNFYNHGDHEHKARMSPADLKVGAVACRCRRHTGTLYRMIDTMHGRGVVAISVTVSETLTEAET